MTAVAEILIDVRSSLRNATGTVGLAVLEKFQQVLDRNPGFDKMCDIGSVLSGIQVPGLEMHPNIIKCFKFAPLTSCDVERSFSVYKGVLTDKRTSFTPENLEMYLVTHCEQKSDDD